MSIKHKHLVNLFHEYRKSETKVYIVFNLLTDTCAISKDDEWCNDLLKSNIYVFFKRIDRVDFWVGLKFNTNVKNITPIAIVNSLMRNKCRNVF